MRCIYPNFSALLHCHWDNAPVKDAKWYRYHWTITSMITIDYFLGFSYINITNNKNTVSTFILLKYIIWLFDRLEIPYDKGFFYEYYIYWILFFHHRYTRKYKLFLLIMNDFICIFLYFNMTTKHHLLLCIVFTHMHVHFTGTGEITRFDI